MHKKRKSINKFKFRYGKEKINGGRTKRKGTEKRDVARGKFSTYRKYLRIFCLTVSCLCLISSIIFGTWGCFHFFD